MSRVPTPRTGTRRRGAAWLAAGVLSCGAVAPAVRAQNTSTVVVTYTSLLATSPSAADFNAGRVVAGYADVSVTFCGRSSCQLRMAATTPGEAGAASVRYVVAATTPTMASCSTLLSTAAIATAPVILTVPPGQTSGSARVYFCVDLSWTGTPPASWTPGVTFRVQQGQ